MKIIREIFRPEPEVLYLEPYFGCNFRCFCCVHGSELQSQPAELNPSVFEKLKPIIAKVRHVHFTGLGEPLLNRHLLDYLGYLREQGKSYYIITNGSLINEALIDLMTTSRSELSVSLDAGNRQTYEYVRHRRYWPGIMAALKRIAKVRADRKTRFPLVYLTFHINAMNLLSLVQLPELCSELGVDAVKLSWTHLPTQYRGYSLFNDQARVAELLDTVSSQLQRGGIHVQSEAAFNKHERGCWALSTMAFVNASGTVAACCSRWITVGSLLENRFEDIWNGMPRRKSCLAILNGKPEESCRDCRQIRGVDYETNAADFLKPDDLDKKILAEKARKPDKLPSLDGLASEFHSGIHALLGADLQAAVSIYSRLDERFPEFFEIKNNLAVSHYGLGNREKCREILFQATEIPHNERLIQWNLDVLRGASGN